MRDEDIATIRRLSLFEGLAQDSFEAILQATYLQRFPAQVSLIREGDPSDFAYVVVEGCVAMTASHAGRETTITLVRPVSAFILAAVLTDSPYLMSARTTEPSRILMIPAADIREVFYRDAAFARAIVAETSWAYRTLVKTLKEQKLRTGTERLAAYLLRLRTESGGGEEVRLPVDKRTVAALLGMTPENLSRAFSALAAHGVEVSGRSIRIVDREALEGLAKPTPLIDDPKF